VTVLEVIQRSAEFLARKGVESPRLQVELLLAHVLKLPRLELYLNFERVLTEPELDTLRDLVKRRGRREPLQYLTGEAAFCGRDFRVTPAVLIPRPETEELAERAGQWLEARGTRAGVLDFGTGSGCLAVTLALRLPGCPVWALDVSEAALAVARENAARHGVTERIRFVQGEGLGALPPEPRFAAFVANPPYIPDGDLAGLPPEVRDFEPREALAGGPDGLRFMRELAGGGDRLQPDGRLFLEFGDGQEDAVAALFREAGWAIEAIERDLRGTPRILVARPGGS
jgi:release factor glutamine methyltransferase